MFVYGWFMRLVSDQSPNVNPVVFDASPHYSSQNTIKRMSLNLAHLEQLEIDILVARQAFGNSQDKFVKLWSIDYLLGRTVRYEGWIRQIETGQDAPGAPAFYQRQELAESERQLIDATPEAQLPRLLRQLIADNKARCCEILGVPNGAGGAGAGEGEASCSSGPCCEGNGVVVDDGHVEVDDGHITTDVYVVGKAPSEKRQRRQGQGRRLRCGNRNNYR